MKLLNNVKFDLLKSKQSSKILHKMKIDSLIITCVILSESFTDYLSKNLHQQQFLPRHLRSCDRAHQKWKCSNQQRLGRPGTAGLMS